MSIRGNYLAFGSALLMPLLVIGTGCSTLPDSGPVTIEVGSFQAPYDALPWLETEIAAFEEAHPDIHVHVKNLSEPLRRRFESHESYFGENIRQFLAADVIGIDTDHGYMIPYLVEKNVLKPLDEFAQKDPDFSFDDFYPNQVDRARYAGSTWGVPWLAYSNILVLDWELFEEAGIENPPRTWQELIDAAALFTKDTNDNGTIDQWGMRVRTNDNGLPYLIASMTEQQHGSFMRDGRLDLSSPVNKEIFQHLHDLAYKQRILKVDNRGMSSVLRDSSVRYAMHLLPSNSVGAALDQPHLRLAPVPGIVEGQPDVAQKRHYYSIRKSNKRRERAAWEFVKWMTREDIAMPPTFAGFPARMDFVEREDFREVAQHKIQNLQLIYEAPGTATEQLQQVFKLANGMELYWSILGEALSDMRHYDRLAQTAELRANRALGKAYND